MCNCHQSSVRGVTRVPGVDGEQARLPHHTPGESCSAAQASRRRPPAPRPLLRAPAAVTRVAAATAPARTAMRARASSASPTRHLTTHTTPPVHPASEPPCSMAGILPHSTPAGRALISGSGRLAKIAIALNTHEMRRPMATPSGGSEHSRERWRHGRLHEQERATHDQASACRLLISGPRRGDGAAAAQGDRSQDETTNGTGDM
jgi:hypothetical protein